MIKSMTGYGCGQSKTALGQVCVEIKTLNHRFLDISAKLPSDFNIFEDKIKKSLEEKIKRGKVYIAVSVDNRSTKESLINIDEKALKRCYGLLNQINKKLKLCDSIKIDHLLAFNGVISYEKPVVKLESYWPRVRQAINEALREAFKARTAEGRIISRNLDQHLGIIARDLKVIQTRIPKAAKVYKKQLKKKIRDLGVNLSEIKDRITAEVAVFLQRSDITEEVNRIKGHLSLFKKAMAGKEVSGRKLDFICQELHREINTLGVKSPDSKILEKTVNIKVEIEKIKEQVQNVE